MESKLVVVCVVVSMMVTAGMGNKDWSFGNYNGTGFNNTSNWPWPWGPTGNQTTSNKQQTIVVGGSDWRFGFDYNLWAFQNAPFFVKDTLGQFIVIRKYIHCNNNNWMCLFVLCVAVFKYAAPNATQPFKHSVYLMPDMRSYMRCDFRRAKNIANINQGGGDGFKFVLSKWRPYYFACGEHDGIHCRDGLMKFFVMPLRSRSFHWF